MRTRSILLILTLILATVGAIAADKQGQQQLAAQSGGTLYLELKAGGSVSVTGDGGSSVSVDYELSCTPACDIHFEERGGDIAISTVYADEAQSHNASNELEIHVSTLR